MMTGKPTAAKVGQRRARYLAKGDAALVEADAALRLTGRRRED